MSKQAMGMGNVSQRRSMGRGTFSSTKAANQTAGGRNAERVGQGAKRPPMSTGKATTKGE